MYGVGVFSVLFPKNSLAIMNDAHPLLNNAAPKMPNGDFCDDWGLSKEKSSTESACLFDGKIIARMPDLGSGSIAKNIKKPVISSFWGQACASVLSVFRRQPPSSSGTGQRFFRRLTTFGGIVILCGIGILLIGKDKGTSVENAVDVGEISVDNTEVCATESVVTVAKPTAKPAEKPATETAATPPAKPAEKPATETAATPPAKPVEKPATEPAEKPTSSVAAAPVVPVASAESVAAAVGPPKPVSPWDRPAVDAFASLDTVPKQPESPPPPINMAAIAPATDATSAVAITQVIPADAVPLTPMSQINGVSMPISPYEMPPISPLELQRVAQSNTALHPSGGAYAQPNYYTVPPAVASQQNMLMQAPAQQQLPHPVQGQGAPVNNSSGQFRQQSQYAVPPGYMLPNNQVIPQSTPIPSGASTLSAQGGPPIQSLGMPMQNMQPQNPTSDFYNVSPAYRRVY